MPKKCLDEFFEDAPMYQGLRENSDLKKIFEILNRDENIFMMIAFSKLGKPSLMPIVPEIEKYIDSRGEESQFDISIDFNRQCIGRICRFILEPFGYLPIKNSSKSFTSKYFRTASCYEFHPEFATMTVEVITHEK